MNPETISKPTVLVVAHDLEDSLGFCRVLQAAGYAVRYAASYAEGLAYLDHQPIEFVIVNQGTAAFEARHLLERAIEKNRHLPVLVLTRALDIKIYLEAMNLGALDYLETPVSADLIVKSVRAHTFERSHPMPAKTEALPS